jgi:hypothetical protein
MKHFKKDIHPLDLQGFAEGRRPNLSGFHKGPIMIEDILKVEIPFEKEDLIIREMGTRTDPINKSSPTIRRRC